MPIMLLTAGLFGTKLRQMTRKRTTVFFFASWALVVLPALCTAGAVGHACDCGVSFECRHESDCSSDPCSELTARRPERDNDVANAVPLVMACASFAAGIPQRAGVDVRESFSEPPSTRNLPYPPGDVPLLI